MGRGAGAVTGYDALYDSSGEGDEGPGLLLEAVIGGFGAFSSSIFVFGSALALVRQELVPLGLRQHPLEERPGDVAAEQPLPILREHGRVPDPVILPRPTNQRKNKGGSPAAPWLALAPDRVQHLHQHGAQWHACAIGPSFFSIPLCGGLRGEPRVNERTHDMVLRGGTVYDGTGRPARAADVALRGDRIAAVAPGLGPGRTEVDVSGLAVSPGFIDVHAHDDFAVLLEPELPFKLFQGVTTVVVGNCGSGVVPFEAGLTRFRRFHPAANPRPWRGFGEYLARVDEVRPALNVGVLIGHGSLRRGAMGLAARAPQRGRARADAGVGARRAGGGCAWPVLGSLL